MKLIENKEFVQISLAFGYFLLAIGEFVILGLDINFLVTFILAIFTIFISIFFFIKSNEIAISIKESLKGIEKDMQNKGGNGLVEGLKIFPKVKKIEKFKKNKTLKRMVKI